LFIQSDHVAILDTALLATNEKCVKIKEFIKVDGFNIHTLTLFSKD